MSDKNLYANMLKQERLAFIIREINLHNRIVSADLCQLLGVSEDTIRRDLNELAEIGKLTKVHGGALSISYNQHGSRADIYAHQSKDIIAQKALTLLHEGMSILTGGGTTIRTLATILPENLKLTCFTVSPQIALELVGHGNWQVIMIGGQISPQTQICMGGETIHRLSEIRIDLCLMGTNGLDIENGLTESEWETSQVKKAMMRAADKTAILSISEKFGSVYRMKYADINDIDYLITELPPTDPALEGLKGTKVEVL
jgi:DeoR/GlpR family transcriptional regulator of sugar metabolism